MGVSKETNRSEEDSISTPQPGEKMATFYERSKTYWAQKAMETSQGEGNRGKELRRDGFAVSISERRMLSRFSSESFQVFLTSFDLLSSFEKSACGEEVQ